MRNERSASYDYLQKGNDSNDEESQRSASQISEELRNNADVNLAHLSMAVRDTIHVFEPQSVSETAHEPIRAETKQSDLAETPRSESSHSETSQGDDEN